MPFSNEEISDTDSDDGLKEDIEKLRRACQITGTNPTDNRLQLHSDGGDDSSETESDGEDDADDNELVQSIQKRFAVSRNVEEEPLTPKPLITLPPDWSDSDDSEDDDNDFETLRAIQRRFASYNDGGLKDNSNDFLDRYVQVGATAIDSDKETSKSLFVERTNAREGFLNCVDKSGPIGQNLQASDDIGGRQNVVEWDRPEGDDVAGLPLKSSHFPKSAHAFVDAIKKNRSCQKLIRSKMMQMEARIEELKKLMERVKILKDFHVACRKRTGRALSQKRDARVQLISVPKQRTNSKLNEKVPAIYRGPPDNLHVAKYKEALATFPVSASQEKWSKEEKENLVKGVKQQFQGMLLQRSVDLLSDTEGSSEDSTNVDSIMLSIKDLDITPEKMRLFLPKVNWEQLATMYVPGRSGEECQARFLNCEDPLINHNPWTAVEDKNLLHIVQQKGLSNWIDIAASLGTNRTPFQCLARYQRSLNASILKREWTKEEDNELRAAVETFGESNWQVVASAVEGRTGTQCSNRWMKTLHPARQRVGKWTAEEDKRLKVAVTLFGPKTWKKVARCVPGRTQVQCRERWVNCLDPSLNMAEWTEEEDSKLEAAIAEHGYCWSKVAACIPCRTDNQCWRRWKVLFPHEVPLLQAARKIQKTALISNFVDRESERSTLGPNDFIPPETYRITESVNDDPSKTEKRRSRKKACKRTDTPSGEICSEEVPRLTNGSEVENRHLGSTPKTGRGKSSRSRKKKAGPSSEVDDCNLKRSLRLQKKRSRIRADSASVSGAIENGNRVIEARSDEYEATDLTEECPLPLLDTSLHRVTVGGELSEHDRRDATKGKKASKRHPRRCPAKLSVEVPETVLEVETNVADSSILKMKNKMKNEKKKQAGSTFDLLSSFYDSLSPTDIRQEVESSHEVRAKKKRKIQKICPSSEAVALHVDEASTSQIMVEVEPGSRNRYDDCSNQVSEQEYRDDTTLAHLYGIIKKRRTKALKK
ncbi:hypothetical protein ACJIZ3_004535 [Penstemon smallii]|uniref:Uncharacterized protein n=1 Tax=Penstemon smallii TaxID=265156 RepID=A0ABD3S2D7_9LAMI